MVADDNFVSTTAQEKPMDLLAGKTAIVTGASRGIGRATARRLAADGASVVVNYRSEASAAATTVAEIKRQGGTAIAVQADISRPPDVDRMFQETIARFGQLDILVANAAYACFKPFDALSLDDFDRTFAVNARGTFLCLREALRYLTRGGRIIGISTIGTTLNLTGGSCYFASKAAVEQLCRTLAREVAPRGITVNLVSPGFTATDMLNATTDTASREQLIDMTPAGRIGEPSEIAEVVAFLASGRAGWITRQNIAVDGGIVSR